MPLVAGGAGRLAVLVSAGAGTDAAADRAGHLGASVAAVAKIGLSVACVAGDALELPAPPAGTPWSVVTVVTEVADRAVSVEESGGRGLAAAHARVHGAFPAGPAEGLPVLAADGRSSRLAALGALLDDVRVRVVAGIADAALRAAGCDAYALATTAGACGLPAPGVATGAKPAFGPELTQVAAHLPAVCTAGTDHGVPGIVQNFSEPQQHRRTERTARGQRVTVDGQVPGEFLQEARRPSNGDRHRDHQHGRGLLRVERRQSRRELTNSGARRGLHACCLRGESGDGRRRGRRGRGHRPSGRRIEVRRTAGSEPGVSPPAVLRTCSLTTRISMRSLG